MCDFDLWLTRPLVVKNMQYYVMDSLKSMDHKLQLIKYIYKSKVEVFLVYWAQMGPERQR